jgi:hypothetical protein
MFDRKKALSIGYCERRILVVEIWMTGWEKCDKVAQRKVREAQKIIREQKMEKL